MSIWLNIMILMIFSFTLSAFDTYTEAFSAGRKAEQQKQFAEAVACYRKAEALAGNPNERYNSVFRRAEAFQQDRKWDDARRTLQEISKISGMNSHQLGTALIYVGHYFYWEGNLNEAGKVFEEISKNKKVHLSSRVDALINLGNILGQQKNLNRAVVIYEKAASTTDIQPYLQATAYLRMASVYKKSGEYDKAHKALESAENISNLPSTSLSAVIIQRGELYYTEKKYYEAIEEFNRIFVMDAPLRYHLDIVDWHLGNIYYHGLKDMDKAKIHYLRARKSPVNWIRKNASEYLNNRIHINQ
jgi:tetratricopeptide (TPR) repeat protein